MSKYEAIGNTGKKEQLKWTEIMDNAFIQAMVTQQDKGNRINGTFTSQAYSNMIEELNTNLRMDFNKNHLKNRLKTLKERFSQWYDMFRGTSLSGFSWNSDTQLIEAEDEVWDKLIDSKPEAIMLKTRKVSNYNEMLELFAKDRASGAHAETAKERHARLQKNDGIKIETITEVDDLLAANEVTLENQYNNDDDIQVVYSPPEQSLNAKKYNSKKRKVEQEDDSFSSKLMKCVDNVANAIQEGNKIFDRVYHREYTGEEIYKELELMGLEPHEIPRALNFLAANQAKARTLFSCPLQIRIGVLKDMIGAGYFFAVAGDSSLIRDCCQTSLFRVVPKRSLSLLLARMLPCPIVAKIADSVLRCHTGAVTAIAFSPRLGSVYQLTSGVSITCFFERSLQCTFSTIDECIIEHGALPCLLNLLTDNHKKSIKKEACWTISNITAGNKEQYQAWILWIL
ncbi:hypothetical protein L1987_13868 [Smallanthus sonchifolius]|uniref:Uncharacterized protein n=1 Tax=Smallanthus sonchifolius TaxID=185202 RepID=A0ACB9JI45_9ASTR|nr:hypothetical protein L1987_13868 [Smallanthus sonchifolius]